MFCPKCGTQNPDDGKFCRSCGVDLGGVSAALSGNLPAKSNDWGMGDWGDWGGNAGTAHVQSEARRRADPSEVYGDGVKGVITGVGFLIVSLALLFTGVAGGHAWWWALLFPSFFGFAKGFSDIAKYKKMIQRNPAGFASPTDAPIGNTTPRSSLPAAQTEFVAPESRYRTGDLVPPSVTDSTTRHLEMNNESETMTLPKK